MNVTTCIFASPIFKYIYYLILYQWQLYIHVRSTIHFFLFFFGRRLSSSASTIRVNFIPIWWDIINNIKAMAIMIFALPKLFIPRWTFVIVLTQDLHKMTATSSLDEAETLFPGRVERVASGQRAQISSIQNSRIISVKHSTSLHVPHSNEWHTTFFYQIFLIAFIN